MGDWNIVICVKDRGFRSACELLEELGDVRRTDFYNVLVMDVEDPWMALEELRKMVDVDPNITSYISKFIPSKEGFSFQSRKEFEDKAGKIVKKWADEIAGHTFHVRMHRRGFKKKISSQQEEQFLAKMILDTLHEKGKEARISFEDPDFIVSVETVGNHAGLSLWSREDLKRYPFLGLD